MKLPLPYTPLLLAVLCFQSWADENQDEYEYIATPKANQVADLTDDDRDGVINARDLCPGTPLGSQLDNDGCGELVVNKEEGQLHILFENDSSQISSVFASQIESMAAFLNKYPSASIEIQGYTSSVGSPEYNLALSKRRALAVENKLLSYGINKSRVRIVGYGENRLEAKGNDEVSHALNRRVTAKVVGVSKKVVEEWNIFSIIAK